MVSQSIQNKNVLYQYQQPTTTNKVVSFHVMVRINFVKVSASTINSLNVIACIKSQHRVVRMYDIHIH